MLFYSLPPVGEQSLVIRYSSSGFADSNNRRAAQQQQRGGVSTSYSSPRFDKAKSHIECYEGWYCQNRS